MPYRASLRQLGVETVREDGRRPGREGAGHADGCRDALVDQLPGETELPAGADNTSRPGRPAGGGDHHPNGWQGPKIWCQLPVFVVRMRLRNFESEAAARTVGGEMDRARLQALTLEHEISVVGVALKLRVHRRAVALPHDRNDIGEFLFVVGQPDVEWRRAHREEPQR